jgi:DNA primase large subunit
MDVRTLARYPFFRESGQLIRSKDISLEDLVGDIALERARLMGKRRVLAALEKGEVPEAPFASEYEALLELLSYPVARMLVASVQDPYLTRRYALSEAVAANSRLQVEEIVFIEAVAKELEVDLSRENGSARIHFSDFLRYTNQMRSKTWKLINQIVDGGYVILTKQKAIRVLQNAIQKKIEKELEEMVVNDLILRGFQGQLEEIRGIVAEKKARFKAEDLGKVRITRFPPCMYQLLAMVQAGENVPHTGRFAIVSFLHNLGMSNEEIFNVFATVPDFDERKTGYQIEHITGKISSTEYTPPECATMKSYGLCPGPDETCLRIRHPLSYYRLKARMEGQKGTGSPPRKAAK